MVKGTYFIVVIKVTNLLRPREGDYAGLSRWVQQSHRSLKQKRKQRDVKHRNDLMCVVGLRMEGTTGDENTAHHILRNIFYTCNSPPQSLFPGNPS